jgi:cytosine/creatinine deaminase
LSISGVFATLASDTGIVSGYIIFLYWNETMTIPEPDYRMLLRTAIQEAETGKSEGGIPIGAALFRRDGSLLGRGHNRRVQLGDPSLHAETDAFRNAGRQTDYRDTIMVTTLSPCWYCCGLVKQFRIGTVVIGESVNFCGGQGWLREQGVRIIELHSEECIRLLGDFIGEHPALWNEDIGEV